MRTTQFFRRFGFVLAFCLPLLCAMPAWSADQTPSSSIATATQATSSPAAATPADATQPDATKAEPAWVAPKPWFIYTVIGIVLIGSIYALLLIRAALANSKWSISDALSEETAVTATKTVNGTEEPMLDANQQPVTISEMRASTSRLVALLGMIVIVMMFLGFGTFALFEFAVTGNMPKSIDNVVNYLLAGLTLFAPYVANKFSSIFSSLTPKR